MTVAQPFRCVTCGLPLTRYADYSLGKRTSRICHDATLAEACARAKRLRVPLRHSMIKYATSSLVTGA